MSEIKFITKNDKLYSCVCALRKQVFFVEQGNEFFSLSDEFENDSTFAVLVDGDIVLSCVRIHAADKSLNVHIDNVATAAEFRGHGYGKELVTAVLEFAKNAGAVTCTVNAQSHAIGFYESCGFAMCSLEQTINGVKSVKMTTKPFDLFSSAKWVGCETDEQAFVVGKVFSARKATLRIAALGFIEIYVNGKKIPFMNKNKNVGVNSGDHFIPALSNYEKRDLSTASYPIFDTMTQRVYYLDFDISKYLNKSGENFLAIHVGAGWYGWKNKFNSEGMKRWGRPKVIFEVLCGDKKISSDGDCLCKKSFVTDTDIYISEIIDGTGYDDNFFTEKGFEKAKNTVCYENFPTLFTRQTFPGDRVDGRIKPKVISKTENKTIYDLGEDVAGKGVFRFLDSAVPGDECVTIIAEELDENGELDLQFTGGTHKHQKDTYICGESMRTFTPVFTWRAGRFVEVDGPCELVEFDRIYSPVKCSSEFKCGNDTINWLYKTYIKTQNSNIHDFVPSDCPHRERLGYTGDGQLCSDAAMTIFDARQLYEKWMTDIMDCQDIFGGHVQHTAPFMGGGGGPGGWGGAVCIVPWNFYKHYGDNSVLEKYYPNMKKYISNMLSRSRNNIVVREEENGWCLGDWCTLKDIEIPECFVNTYFLIKCVDICLKTADILSNKSDRIYFSNLKMNIEKSFCDTFFDRETGSFAGGVQGADAFALDIGLGDERTLENLVQKYTDDCQYDTGIFGTPIVTRVLFENGYERLAYKLLTNENTGSYYNMKSHGATTLWEYWTGEHSHSHPMFGAVCEQLFSEILGIKQTEDGSGYEKITVEPAFLPELGDVEGRMNTVNGEIYVKVSYDSGKMNVEYRTDEKISVL